ncbi:MAG TPA: tyrosine-type recombinase/integrase [Flavipsychrobacter sp.]|nr:tyrosine-type recombinase/integrase [Flavipsychrobacter sp.]
MDESVLTEFIHYLRFEKRFSPHTLLAYREDLEQFVTYTKDQFELTETSQVTHFHLRSWLASLKSEDSKPRTINRKISSLQSFFRFLLKNGRVSKNPVKQLHSLRLEERLPQFLKEPEAENLLEEIAFEEGFKGKTDRLICELLYQTGMRRAELIQLKEQDIEWSLRQIRVLGKGNKERLLPLGPALLDELRQYLLEKKKITDNNAVLVLANGNSLYETYVYRTVQHYMGKVTTLKKKSPHILRHSFATHLLNNGANIQAIKDLLGHSSLAATQIYTHNNIEKLKEIHKLNHPRG